MGVGSQEKHLPLVKESLAKIETGKACAAFLLAAETNLILHWVKHQTSRTRHELSRGLPWLVLTFAVYLHQ